MTNPWVHKRAKGGLVLFDRERIYRYVRLVRATGCWEWQGKLTTPGYGRVTLSRSVPGPRHRDAHRFSYETFVGPVPRGLLVLHRCANRKCCNPEHLYAGTYQQNVNDAMERDGWYIGERNGRAKVCADDVRKMRADYAAGTARRDLAARHGISLGAVGSILARRTWTHIDEEHSS